MGRIHGVEDILLGFEPKDAGSIPAGSVFFVKKELIKLVMLKCFSALDSGKVSVRHGNSYYDVS